MDASWTPPFTGRDEEIAFLRNELLAACNPTSTGPRIAVLLGESGLGKTAVVQQFYEQLVAEAQGDYWPSTMGTAGKTLRVNPDFTDHVTVSRTPMPFLWWGLRAPNLSERNTYCESVLEKDLMALLPHLSSLRRAQHNRTAATRAGKIVLNLVSLGLSSHVADALTLVQTGFDVREAWAQRKDGPVQDRAEEKAALRERLRVIFSKLLKEKGARRNTSPLILVADDAQFLDVDQEALAVISEILQLANDRQYPVLLIICHWEAEWYQQIVNGYCTDRGRPGITSLVYDRQPPWNLEWQRKDRTLIPSSIMTIRPLPEMSVLIQHVAPGLPERDVELIAMKTGGNPLLLEQIYYLYLTDAAYFTNGSLARGLTATAESAIRRRRFELHDLIEERLRKRACAQVAAMLRLAVLQGPIFSEELLVGTLPDEDQSQVQSLLHDAINLYRLIANTGPGLFEFSQPAVFEVLSTQVKDRGDDSVNLPALFHAATRMAVATASGRGMVGWRLLPILSGVLEQGRSPEAIHATALVDGMICALCMLRQRPHEAKKSSLRVSAYQPSQNPVSELPPTLLYYASEVRYAHGDVRRSHGLSARALNLIGDSPHERNTITGAPLFLDVLYRYAEQCRLTGRLDEAERALPILLDEIDTATQSTAFHRRLILTLAGRIAQTRGNLDLAARRFSQVIADATAQIDDEFPSQAVVVAMTDYADVMMRKENWIDARDSLQYAWQIAVSFLVPERTPNDVRLALLVAHRQITVACCNGDKAAAFEALELARSLGGELLVRLPTQDSHVDVALQHLCAAEVGVTFGDAILERDAYDDFFSAIALAVDVVPPVRVLSTLVEAEKVGKSLYKAHNLQHVVRRLLGWAHRVLRLAVEQQSADEEIVRLLQKLLIPFYEHVRGGGELVPEFEIVAAELHSIALQRCALGTGSWPSITLWFSAEMLSVKSLIDSDPRLCIERLYPAIELARYEKTSKSNPESLDNYAVLSTRLGECYNLLGEYERAAFHFREAMQASLRCHREHGFSVASLNNYARHAVEFVRLAAVSKSFGECRHVQHEVARAVLSPSVDYHAMDRDEFTYLCSCIVVLWMTTSSDDDRCGVEYWLELVELLRTIEANAGQRIHDEHIPVALLNLAEAYARSGEKASADRVRSLAATEIRRSRSISPERVAELLGAAEHPELL